MLTSLNDHYSDFAFIAFSTLSGKAIAHGRLAIDAIHRTPPTEKIQILAAGDAGEWIWSNNLSLTEARSTLKERSSFSLLM